MAAPNAPNGIIGGGGAGSASGTARVTPTPSAVAPRSAPVAISASVATSGAKPTATGRAGATATATATVAPTAPKRANIPAPTDYPQDPAKARGSKASGPTKAANINAPTGPAVANALTTVIYLHSDHLGSVSMATDAWGNVVSRQEFDTWGKVRAQSNSGSIKKVPF